MRKTQCKCDFTASRLQLVPAEGLQSSVKSCCVSQHSAPCTAMHFWHEPTLMCSPWARSYFAGVILPVVCLKLVLWFHPQKCCSCVSTDLLWAEVTHGRKHLAGSSPKTGNCVVTLDVSSEACVYYTEFTLNVALQKESKKQSIERFQHWWQLGLISVFNLFLGSCLIAM